MDGTFVLKLGILPKSITPASPDAIRGAIFASFSFRKNCDAFYGQLEAIVWIINPCMDNKPCFRVK